LSKKTIVAVICEMLGLKNPRDTMCDPPRRSSDVVTRVAREVGTEGKLGGQAKVKGVAGTWKDLTDNVNLMGSNLTNQVRNMADVTTAVARGDLSKRMTVGVEGRLIRPEEHINTTGDQLHPLA